MGPAMTLESRKMAEERQERITSTSLGNLSTQNSVYQSLFGNFGSLREREGEEVCHNFLFKEKRGFPDLLGKMQTLGLIKLGLAQLKWSGWIVLERV